ncbi:hypothetical protein FB446DRAFT_385762 [Lentinula raphanica]|nr:hypothetical protein FB446DRAFT_385762 [Lentinula raphanica]
MHNDETVDFFPWLDPNATDNVVDLKTPEVKAESHTDFSSLFSPPSSPFITSSALTGASHSIRRRSTKSESPRTRPYPELRPSSEETIGMSGTSGSSYDNWNNRSRGSDGRRSSVGGYPLYQSTTYDSSGSISSSARLSRSSSGSSSSFQGAVGTSSCPSGSGSRMVSLSPRHPDAQLVSMTWPQEQIPMSTPSDMLYPGVAGDVPYHLSPDITHGGFTTGAPSSSTIYYDDTTTPIAGYAPTHDVSTTHSQLPVDHDLHQRIAELEEQHFRDAEEIQALRSQLAAYTSGSMGSPPLPPVTPHFQASWAARTNARVKFLCSLNRAGNALCAWHDSRRERRVYPPRNAPPNTLNCGCTYEEALFEESLSRHRVGSYLPGDTVRMDPNLRNPLLRLLKERYGYRDGDFERDPLTGDWKQTGEYQEGHEHWERLLASGVNPRRAKGDSHHGA